MRKPGLATVCIDCSDAHAMAAFYVALLGLEVAAEEPDWVLLRDPAGGTTLSFQAERDYIPPVWPQTTTDQRMMMHLDIWVDDLDAETARAVAAGARVADYQPQERVRVLIDPAGHPFCLFLD